MSGSSDDAAGSEEEDSECDDGGEECAFLSGPRGRAALQVLVRQAPAVAAQMIADKQLQLGQARAKVRGAAGR